MESRIFANKIIGWYLDNKRDLPWRNTKDPYRIWLSEIILQQTRVAQGLPYYQAFTEKFPTVWDLSKAEERVVLRTWQGLGYYSRARNLHKCAKIICDNYRGQFPNNYKDLLALPGVGPYTAAAIASFAFGEIKAVVDGNVYRVLSRFFGVHDDIATGSGQRKFAELAQSLISQEKPDLYNQGIMEFGAMQCTPKSPNCHSCVLEDSCVAYHQHLQHQLPVKSKKVKVRERYFYYFNMVKQGHLLMKKRLGKGIWEGLYDFYLYESANSLPIEEVIDLNPLKEVDEGLRFKIEISEEYTHILSHQKIKAVFLTVYLESVKDIIVNLPEGLNFYSLKEVSDLPKPVLISHYLNATFF